MYTKVLRFRYRFTVKAFVVQDCYTTNGEKKSLEHVSEVLRLLVKPKPEVTGEEIKGAAGMVLIFCCNYCRHRLIRCPQNTEIVYELSDMMN